MTTSTSNNKTTAISITEDMFQVLNNFFGGQFHLGVHGISNIDGKIVKWGHTVARMMHEDNIHRNAELSDMAYCRLKNREEKNIFVRPSFETEEYYILFDDLDAANANRFSRKPGTLVVNSSPGKFQVWLHLDRPMSNEEKMLHILRVKADPDAKPKNRWGRCPGFRNYKPKYAPKYPISRLVSVTEGLASLPVMEAEIKPAVKAIYNTTCRTSTGVNIRRDRYESGDESRTDFRYTLALLHFGVSDEEIMTRLLTERTNWENKTTHSSLQEKYIRMTIANAKKYQRA